MRPTFNGITHIDYRDKPDWTMPSLPVRIWDFCINGRTYHEVIAKSDGQWTSRLEIVPRIGLGPLKLFKQAVFQVGNEIYKTGAPDENAPEHLGLHEREEGGRRDAQPLGPCRQSAAQRPAAYVLEAPMQLRRQPRQRPRLLRSQRII